VCPLVSAAGPLLGWPPGIGSSTVTSSASRAGAGALNDPSEKPAAQAGIKGHLRAGSSLGGLQLSRYIFERQWHTCVCAQRVSRCASREHENMRSGSQA
jgi:hypothetical protein